MVKRYGKYIWTKGRVSEDRGSKETDRYPLTSPSLP
jgi:hypothetical protein